MRGHPARRESISWREAIREAVTNTYPEAPFTSPPLGTKFTVEVYRHSPDLFTIAANGSLLAAKLVKVPGGSYVCSFAGESHKFHYDLEPGDRIRMTLDGKAGDSLQPRGLIWRSRAKVPCARVEARCVPSYLHARQRSLDTR